MIVQKRWEAVLECRDHVLKITYDCESLVAGISFSIDVIYNSA